jgi:hypothetical protein
MAAIVQQGNPQITQNQGPEIAQIQSLVIFRLEKSA